MELSENARITYEKRYLIKDQHGHPVETPEDLLRRVAKNIAAVEKDYKKDQQQIEQIEEEFFQVMADALFMPNSPTLMNAGRELQQLSACFVLPIEDSMEGIFTSLKQMALVQKTGGGTGFAFDRLRPSGDFVCSTNGVASGPISFLKIFDAATEAVKQGGTRRGANMGSLIYNHPNILDFICCKENEDEITNFNLSVTVSDEFMRKATGEDPDPMYPLINPRNGQPHVDPETGQTVSLNAVEVFNLIVDKAWSKGDPGVIFIDQMNRFNPTPHLGKYETTNPCGEQPLLPYEACCLGSINLGKFVTPERQINWDELRRVIKIAVRFLDNVIDASNYVIEEIAQMHKHGNRKIGLGVMGWHDMLVKLGIPYDSGRGPGDGGSGDELYQCRGQKGVGGAGEGAGVSSPILRAASMIPAGRRTGFAMPPAPPLPPRGPSPSWRGPAAVLSPTSALLSLAKISWGGWTCPKSTLSSWRWRKQAASTARN